MSKHIDQIIIDKILDAARIEEVIGDFIDLKKKGVRYLAICPFHDDRHLGSFVIYPKGNCYRCFKCGAHGGVVDFLMNHQKLSFPDAIRWLGKKYNIDTDMEEINFTPVTRQKPAELPTLTLPLGMVTARQIDINRETTGDNLADWIKTIHWDNVQRSRMAEVIKDYHVGHAKGGHTIFWQIDELGRTRTGKMMKYRTDGHRDKEAHWNFDFIHSVLSRRRDPFGKIIDEGPYPYPNIFNPDLQEMRMTYFGMHLLNRYKRNGVDQTVCIVESEKTALLMAIAYGNNAKQVWMACGGMMNLTRERLAPIINQHRNIILYPDRDGIEQWKQKAEQLHYDHIQIDTKPVTSWWQPCDGAKADIADVVIRCINSSKDWQPNTTNDVIKEMPIVEPLINNLDLQVSNEQ